MPEMDVVLGDLQGNNGVVVSTGSLKVSGNDRIEDGKTMSDEIKSADAIPRLAELAEFRYQLRTFLSFSESASEKFGIAAQQYQLMQVIGATAEGQVTSISYLADRMILRHNSMVELVDRAERAGLVARRNDASDLRRSLVELTPEGWSILQKLVALHLEELQKHADGMIRALRKMQANGNGGRKAKSDETGDAEKR
jgi:DNA-binding MarR family transcriptional regulator